MTAKSAKTPAADYQTLSAKLDAVLAELQHPDVQIDDALRLYEQGMALAAQLEALLQTAQNKLTKLAVRHEAADDV